MAKNLGGNVQGGIIGMCEAAIDDQEKRDEAVLKAGLPKVDLTLGPERRIAQKETKHEITVKVEPFGDGKYRDVDTGFVIDSECKFYGVSHDKVTIQSPTQSENEQALAMGFKM